MRNFYEPISHLARANQLRKDAQECANAGFMLFAQVNAEMAAFLDPPRFEDENPEG